MKYIRIITFTISIMVAEMCLSQNIDTRSWTSLLPDTSRLAELFIPGSHDSATGNGQAPFKSLWKTQDLTLTEQLKAGVRFIDLRINSRMNTCHGRAEFEYTAQDAMNDICSFLDENQKEFVICLIKQEDRKDGESDIDFQLKLSDLLNSERVYSHTYQGSMKGIRLKDIRGKIIFLNRSFSEVKNKVEPWYGGDFHIINDIIAVQDNYKASIEHKKNIVESFYDKYDDTEIIGINFNTCPGISIIPNPRKASTELNRNLENIISESTSKLRGIIVLDYGESLYEDIIMYNFPGKEQK